MMAFDRQNLRVIRADIEQALRAVEQKHGVSFTLGSIRFSPDSFRCRLEADASAKAGLPAADRARKEFEEYAGAFFLKTDDFGKTFVGHTGSRYTICGIKPSSYKYPILARSSRGTVYKFTAEQVLRGLGRTKEADKSRLLPREIDPELLAARRGLV